MILSHRRSPRSPNAEPEAELPVTGRIVSSARLRGDGRKNCRMLTLVSRLLVFHLHTTRKSLCISAPRGDGRGRLSGDEAKNCGQLKEMKQRGVLQCRTGSRLCFDIVRLRVNGRIAIELRHVLNSPRVCSCSLTTTAATSRIRSRCRRTSSRNPPHRFETNSTLVLRVPP